MSLKAVERLFSGGGCAAAAAPPAPAVDGDTEGRLETEGVVALDSLADDDFPRQSGIQE